MQFLQTTPKCQYLNSLCVEMDNRYSLKDAMVRNIKEYNDKFKPAN
jgi:DNA segregation ATPase FtsK/SpoIIIE-like protein